MNVPLSAYLAGIKQPLKRLVEILSEDFPYLSVLSTDSTGMRYSVRGRGIDVLFAGTRRRPDFLIESLALEGEARLAGRRFRFQGTAADVTTQPALHGKPLVLEAQIEAETSLAVKAVLDQTEPTGRQQAARWHRDGSNVCFVDGHVVRHTWHELNANVNKAFNPEE